jgi:hypothetical protein
MKEPKKVDEQKQVKKYIADIQKIDKKYGLSLRAIMKTDPNSGAITPALSIVRNEK